LVIFRDESDWVETEVKLNHQKDCKATVEVLVFTAEEEQKFTDKVAAKRIEEESREIAKAEAESSRQASIEQESIDLSIAESEAANNTEAINETPADNSGSESDGGGTNNVLIIAIAAGAVLVIIIIVVIIIVSGKKKGGK